MGYDLYIVKPADDTAMQLQQLRALRDQQARSFQANNPLSALMQEQDRELKKSSLGLKKQNPGRHSAQTASNEQIAKLRKAYVQNRQDYWQQESAALAQIDSQLEQLEAKLYFHLNIGGMSTFCSVMEQLGMLATAPSSKNGHFGAPAGFPGWPKSESFNLSDQEVDQFDQDYYHNPADCPDQRYRAYQQASQNARAWTHTTAGINQHKFSSNDGWLVTDQEVRSALKTYQQAIANKPKHVEKLFAKLGHSATLSALSPAELKTYLKYWQNWLEFLKQAEAGEGFSVH